MAVQETLQIGNKILRSRACIVRDIDTIEIKKVIDKLITSMRKDNLVGMAAPQIGFKLRIFVTEIRKTTYRKHISQEDGVRTFINPCLKSHSKKQLNAYEGCGSVAEALLFGPVKRYESVVVEARDITGTKFEFEASGFLARVIQHEMDHLDGVLFIDKVADTRELLDRESYVVSQQK